MARYHISRWQHITIHTGRYRWGFRRSGSPGKGIIATPFLMVSWL